VNAKGGFLSDSDTCCIAKAGCANILSLLLDYSGDVDGQRTIGQSTMLVLTSIRGKLKGGGCLLDHRVDVEVRDDRRLTPLSI
jgi:hypothetical protein